MKAIILAGGFATRLWPLTEFTAKPLLKIAGKEIISYIVEKISEDIDIIVSTNAVFEKDFLEWKKKYPQKKITIFVEDSEGEETKKGALAAVGLVVEKFEMKEDLFLFAGDNLFFFDFLKLLKRCSQNPLLAAYDVGGKEEAKKFGVVVPKNETEVGKFQEKPEEPESTLVSTGCLFFPQRNLKDIIDYSQDHNDDLGGIFEYLLSKGDVVEYFEFQDQWYDIGSFPAFLDAQKHIIGEKIINEGKMDAKTKISGSVFIGKNSEVIHSELENVVLEENVTIKNATIRNSVIGKNSTIINVDLNRVCLRQDSFIAPE